MSISPSTDDIRNYLEMRLERGAEPDTMNKELWAGIVRVILEKISNMRVGAFSTPSHH